MQVRDAPEMAHEELIATGESLRLADTTEVKRKGAFLGHVHFARERWSSPKSSKHRYSENLIKELRGRFHCSLPQITVAAVCRTDIMGLTGERCNLLSSR
jgi:hypothetical protein